MKIEQALVHYLLKNKVLTLQGIGTFELNATLPEPTDPEKPVIIPENAISFQYDPRAKEDDGLIDFIVEHSNKIRSLAASDLESFLSLGRQFLNIGNPFTLYNLGTLNKSNSGELVFEAGELIAKKIEPKKIKSDESETSTEVEKLFNDYPQERKSKNGTKAIYTLLILIALGLIGWVVWHYDFNKKEAESISSTEPIIPILDSATLTTDTAHKAMDTTKLNSSINQPKSADSFSFKIVVNEYSSLSAAEKRLADLKRYGRNVIMYSNDSVIFKIAEPFMLPLSDTTKMLDKLKGYYTTVYIDK